jgi:hypothetical protein
MEKKIDAWVDKKIVISTAFGIILALWVMWFGAFLLHGLGMGHRMKGGMQRDSMRGMHNKMMQDGDQSGAAGTFMEGSDIPTGIDTSAM